MSITNKTTNLFIPVDQDDRRRIKHPVQYKGIDNEWTLAEHFIGCLASAMDYFGDRNKDWIFAGIEFGPTQNTPISLHFKNYLIIQLGKDAFDDWAQSVFQLSHEVVHFISPVPVAQVTNLEEGVATWHQHQYIAEHFGPEWFKPAVSGYYFDACEPVKRFFADSSNTVIKKIREAHSGLAISKITSQMLQDEGCSGADADFLVEIFPMYRS